MRSALTILSFAVLALASTTHYAEACMGVFYDTEDTPISNGPNCSFSSGGSDDWRGDEVVDLGHMLIAQPISQKGSCAALVLQYVVVDCRSQEAAILYYSRASLRSLQPFGSDETIWNAEVTLLPNGHPGELPSGKSLQSIISKGRAMGYQAFHYAGIWPRGIRYGDQYPQVEVSEWFDPQCGCKIFYPDSAGAQN